MGSIDSGRDGKNLSIYHDDPSVDLENVNAAYRLEAMRAGHYQQALALIAADRRRDGSWNRDREACRVVAAEALLYDPLKDSHGYDIHEIRSAVAQAAHKSDPGETDYDKCLDAVAAGTNARAVIEALMDDLAVSQETEAAGIFRRQRNEAYTERNAALAEVERLRAENAKLGLLAHAEARKRGEAEGALEASQWPGVVNGWRDRALRAEKAREDANAVSSRLQRLLNRLDAAITHHKTACVANDEQDVLDESLWAARDRVLRDAHEGMG